MNSWSYVWLSSWYSLFVPHQLSMAEFRGSVGAQNSSDFDFFHTSTLPTRNVVNGQLWHGLGKIELAHTETTFLRANSWFFGRVFILFGTLPGHCSCCWRLRRGSYQVNAGPAAARRCNVSHISHWLLGGCSCWFSKIISKKKILWDYLLGICMGW